MRGAWGKLWVRTVTTVLFAVATTILFSGLPLVHLVWGGGVIAPWGVLDFAGGAVVHVTSWLLLLALLPFWGAAEIKALVTGMPLPLGCYLIFIAVVTLGNGWFSTLAITFTSFSNAALIIVENMIVFVIVATVLAGIYYRLWRQRAVRPSLPTN